MKFEQEIAAATAAILGDENAYRLLDESPSIGGSSTSNHIYPTQMTFMIGEKEDKKSGGDRAWREHRDEERWEQADEIRSESLGALLGNSVRSGRRSQGAESKDSGSMLLSPHW